MSRTTHSTQHRGPHGSLERKSLEDRDVRLARVRRRRLRDRRRGRGEDVDPTRLGPGQSGRMDRILDAGFKQPADESVLIQSRRSVRATRPFEAAVRDVVTGISTLDVVQHVSSPLAPANAGQISPDGHAALVGLRIRGDPDTAVDRVGPVLDRVDELQQAHPQLFIGQFGDASKIDALTTAYGDDLGKAGLLSLPVTLVILLVAFGTLVAAGIPLLLALTAVFATFGLVAIPATSSRSRCRRPHWCS